MCENCSEKHGKREIKESHVQEHERNQEPAKSKLVVLALGVLFFAAALQTFQIAGALNSLSELKPEGFTASSLAGQSQQSLPSSPSPTSQSVVNSLPNQVGGC